MSSSLSHALLGDDIPKVIVVVPFEGTPVLVFDATTRENEARLLAWLRGTKTLELVADQLVHILDDIEDAA